MAENGTMWNICVQKWYSDSKKIGILRLDFLTFKM